MYHPRIDWTPDMDAAISVEGRVNLAQLGRELQVSAGAIRQRVRKLKMGPLPELWSDWQIDILKSEWPKGKLSASQIGNLVGKSRNAVIGKSHRLKLGNRVPSGDKRTGLSRKERPCTKKIYRPKLDMAIIKAKAKPPRFYPEAVSLTTKAPISIGELRFNTCRAPVGRGLDGLVTYCGDFTFGDKPFCEGHCVLFYRLPEARKYR